MAPCSPCFVGPGTNLIFPWQLVQFLCLSFCDNKKGNENLILTWQLVQFLCLRVGDNRQGNENLVLRGGWYSFCVCVLVTIKKGTRTSFCLCFVGDNNSNLLGEPRINIL